MTNKKRVYEIAKELHVTSPAVIDMLKQEGVEVKNHMSTVDDDVYLKIKENFNAKKQEIKKSLEEKEKKFGNKNISTSEGKKVNEQIVENQVKEKNIYERNENIKRPSNKYSNEKQYDDRKITDKKNIEKKETITADKEKKLLSIDNIFKPDIENNKFHKKKFMKNFKKAKGNTDERPIVVYKKKGKEENTYLIEIDDTVKEREVKIKKKFKKKKKHLPIVDKEEVEKSFKKTLAQIEAGSGKSRAKYKKRDRKDNEDIEEENVNKIRVTELSTVAELSELMDVPASQIISKFLSLGQLVSINQRLDRDLIELIAAEFGYEAEFLDEYLEEEVEEEIEKNIQNNAENLVPRPPIVTIMGHVDHGKTTLLDKIRSSNIAATEAGAITQHIGAYQVNLDKGKITFIDTPGHEAFTAMRARGAQVTDIVILVVAADDGVMPQTIEAIDHAKAAGVPIVVAINKIDSNKANIDKVKNDLANHGLIPEEWGGNTIFVPISAKYGTNIEELLESVLLVAEMQELKANENIPARGVVIEAKVEKGRGNVATVLIKNGTLRKGDAFLAGTSYGKIRMMLNDREQKLESAGPSTPVLITGFDSLPSAGDSFEVMDERKAKELSNKRKQLEREKAQRTLKKLTLDSLYDKIKNENLKELNIIIKGDADGSIDAIENELTKLSTEEVKVKVIHKSVGAITENDVLLASASNAIIIGFHVHPELKAKMLAEQEKVDIRLYKIIYQAKDDIEKAMIGLLQPEQKEEFLGRIEIKQVFKAGKYGNVAGCYVLKGLVRRNSKVRLIRDGVEIYNGEIESLKRFQEDKKEVLEGYECGILLKDFNDIKVGDVIEAYEIVEIKRDSL